MKCFTGRNHHLGQQRKDPETGTNPSWKRPANQQWADTSTWQQTGPTSSCSTLTPRTYTRALQGPRRQMQPLHCVCTGTELEQWLDGHQQKPNRQKPCPALWLQAGAVLHWSSALPCSVTDTASLSHTAIGHCSPCEQWPIVAVATVVTTMAHQCQVRAGCAQPNAFPEAGSPSQNRHPQVEMLWQ